MLPLNLGFMALALALAVCLQTAQALFPGPSQMVGGHKCGYQSGLLPRNKEYRQHCEKEAGPSGSDPNWPCAVFWASDLKQLSGARVNSDPNTKEQKYKNIDDLLLIKNGYQTDFTVRDTKASYTLEWFKSVSMTYTYVNATCYDITLARFGDKPSRIWVSKQDSKERDVDTKKNPKPAAVTFCGSKWFHIHIKTDG